MVAQMVAQTWGQQSALSKISVSPDHPSDVIVSTKVSTEAREIKLAKPGSPKVLNHSIDGREAGD